MSLLGGGGEKKYINMERKKSGRKYARILAVVISRLRDCIASF